MKNSAHDDISIIDTNALEHIHDADMGKIYQLIADMQLSEELGAAHLMRQNVKLELKTPDDKDNLFVYFQTNTVMTEGWLAGPLGSLFTGKLSDILTQADIESISKGNFEMQIDLYDENEPLSLTELLHHMDIFEAGRPSTAAGILESLVEKGLITISKEADTVKLTQQGHETHQMLQEHLATVANVAWNSKLMSQLSQIESGELDADTVIFEVLATLYGEQAAESFKHLSWSDPEVLYEQQQLATSIGKIAIVRKQTLEQEQDGGIHTNSSGS